jgi:hypothetical protein
MPIDVIDNIQIEIKKVKVTVNIDIIVTNNYAIIVGID